MRTKNNASRGVYYIVGKALILMSFFRMLTKRTIYFSTMLQDLQNGSIEK
jgi:hypothetical protein